MFPWITDAPNMHPQNVMHLIVTVLVIIFSIAGLILIALGAGKENLKSLRTWAEICLEAMFIGSIGTSVLPESVFGLFERIGTFSAVVCNMILGIYLWKGKLKELENE